MSVIPIPVLGKIISTVGALAGIGGADKGNKTIVSGATVGGLGALAMITQLEGLVEQGIALIVALTAFVTAVQAAYQEAKRSK